MEIHRREKQRGVLGGRKMSARAYGNCGREREMSFCFALSLLDQREGFESRKLLARHPLQLQERRNTTTCVYFCIILSSALWLRFFTQAQEYFCENACFSFLEETAKDKIYSFLFRIRKLYSTLSFLMQFEVF
jgi:hypothetical protein